MDQERLLHRKKQLKYTDKPTRLPRSIALGRGLLGKLIKIISSNGLSDYMSITEEEYQQIRKILLKENY